MPNVDVVILKPEMKKNGSSRQRLTNYDHKTKTIFHLPGNNSQKKESSLKKVIRVLAVKNGVRLPGFKKSRISPATQLKQQSEEIMKQIHDGTSTVNPEFQKMVLHLEKKREERKAKKPTKFKKPKLVNKKTMESPEWQSIYAAHQADFEKQYAEMKKEKARKLESELKKNAVHHQQLSLFESD